jgi:predicted RNA binding protein YcfA (HicA-like mRNA interferase family)
VKRPELVRHLERHGCELLREGGSHPVYVNRAERKVSTVPRHREVNESLAWLPGKRRLERAAIDDESRWKDCATLATLIAHSTKQKPKLWGTSIVGFGSYHYKYESDREGDSFLTGVSSRKGGHQCLLYGELPRTGCAPLQAW